MAAMTARSTCWGCCCRSHAASPWSACSSADVAAPLAGVVGGAPGTAAASSTAMGAAPSGASAAAASSAAGVEDSSGAGVDSTSVGSSAGGAPSGGGAPGSHPRFCPVIGAGVSSSVMPLFVGLRTRSEIDAVRERAGGGVTFHPSFQGNKRPQTSQTLTRSLPAESPLTSPDLGPDFTY